MIRVLPSTIHGRFLYVIGLMITSTGWFSYYIPEEVPLDRAAATSYARLFVADTDVYGLTMAFVGLSLVAVSFISGSVKNIVHVTAFTMCAMWALILLVGVIDTDTGKWTAGLSSFFYWVGQAALLGLVTLLPGEESGGQDGHGT